MAVHLYEAIEFGRTKLALRANVRLSDDLLQNPSSLLILKADNANDSRNREVVQQPKRLWFHPAGRRRQGFVHISAVERAGMYGLNEGQKVTYEVVADRKTGKSSAQNLVAA